MKQYRLSTPNPLIYDVLTIKDDGTMMLYFHGTDRSICKEATMNELGCILAGGSMMPPLDSGRWQEQVEDVRGQTEDVRCKMDDVRGQNSEQPDLLAQMQAELEQLRQENVRLGEMSNEKGEMSNGNEKMRNDAAARPQTSERPRRQRKARQPRLEIETTTDCADRTDNGIRQTSDTERQPSSLAKPLLCIAATVAALVVIYHTGLLIPMGLIGLGATGFLK